jgi:hypothetical protein
MPNPSKYLSVERIRELFDYDAATGMLHWRIRPSNTVKIGDAAGTRERDGHRRVHIDGKAYLVSRVVWAHQKGAWSTNYIFAKDDDPSNSRIENLYEKSISAKNSERSIGKNNSSGVIGVGFVKRNQKWKAWIKRDGNLYHLGYFDDFYDAIAVREAAEKTFVAGGSEAQIKAAGHRAAIERRQRVVWSQINAEYEVAWPSFEAFALDIGDALKTGHKLLRSDDSKPIGPQNFRWFIPPSERHDPATAEGRTQIRREYRRRKPEAEQNSSRQKLYGVGPERFAEMTVAQNGVCAICGHPEKFTARGKPRALSVDHDHETNLVRGLLCAGCNKALGLFGDDPARLRAAAEYIERHRGNIIPLPRKEPA